MSRTYRPNGERERARRMRQGAYFKQLVAEQLQQQGHCWLAPIAMQTEGWQYHVHSDAWVHPAGVIIQHTDLVGGQYARAHATHQG